MELAGQTAVVIGGSSGIGLATAHRLGREGASLVLVGRSADKLRQAAEGFERQVVCHAADLREAGAAKSLFDQVGAFDHLVIGAAGSPAWGPLKDLDPDAVRHCMEGKFFVHFHAARYGAERIRATGSITFITGGTARAAIPGTSALAATSGAVQAMARALARELAPVRVNVVAPGFTDTPAHAGLPEAERQALYERMKRLTPLGTIATPDEIADAIVFLIRNRFATGAVLDVDGGRRLA